MMLVVPFMLTESFMCSPLSGFGSLFDGTAVIHSFPCRGGSKRRHSDSFRQPYKQIISFSASRMNDLLKEIKILCNV